MHPLPLRPDKAALLGNRYHSQATALGRASTPVDGGPTWRLSCTSAAYVSGASFQPMCVLWLVAQILRAPRGPGLLTVSVPVGFPSSSGPSIFPATLFYRCPTLHLMFGCRYLLLFPSTAGIATQRTVMLHSCLQEINLVISQKIGNSFT